MSMPGSSTERKTRDHNDQHHRHHDNHRMPLVVQPARGSRGDWETDRVDGMRFRNHERTDVAWPWVTTQGEKRDAEGNPMRIGGRAPAGEPFVDVSDPEWWVTTSADVYAAADALRRCGDLLNAEEDRQ